MSKQNDRKYLARLITEFANRDPRDLGRMPENLVRDWKSGKYGIVPEEEARIRLGAIEKMALLRDAQWFRAAWDSSGEGREKFAFAVEQVFADRASEMIDETD